MWPFAVRARRRASLHGMFVCAACGQRYDRAGFCAVDGQPLARVTDPLIGTEIGRYRLARLLGEGGMGQVYLGVQPAIGSRVAIKILNTECTRSPELLERFFAEARSVNLINHENIVSVIDLAQLDDGRPYIVMEFIEGQTLRALVREGTAPLGGIVQAMTEVLSALGAAHARGIVHRDLKPDNVIVTAEGHAKVLDFGIAKLAPGLSNANSPRTKTGALLGTPAYMAPEQISGAGNVDGRTDLYAAGVVLFEAVTGRTPFQGDTLFDLMRAHLEASPPSPRALRPELPAGLEQVILRALAKDPAQRFQHASAMTEALHHAARELTPDQWRVLSSRRGGITGRPSLEAIVQPSPSQPGHAPTQPSPSQAGHDPTMRSATPIPSVPTRAPASRRGVWIAIAAIVAVTGGIAVIVASQQGEPPSPPGAAATQAPASEAPGAEAPGAAAPGAAAPPSEVIPPTTAVPPSPPRAAAAVPTPAAPTPARPPALVVGGATVVRPADYNPKRFDPVAYLPKARALAKTLVPDAELTSFEFDPVFPDGRVDLTMAGRDCDYEFRSRARSALPAGHPRNVPLDRPCRVRVSVGAHAVTAEVVDSDTCDARIVRAPRCSFATVWSKARASGVPGELVARIGWLFDQQWFFDTGLGGEGGGVASFEDDC